MRISLVFCLGMAALVGIMGCGSDRPADLPELHPLTIEVTQDGKPLEGATVSLYAEGSKWAVGAGTDATGKAVILTLGEYKGAPAGTYKVCVTKELIETSGEITDDPMAPPVMTENFDLVDPVYKSPETTTLEVEVVAGENNPPAIDVGPAIKEPVPQI